MATTMRTMTISLSPKQAGVVEAAVEAGAYASNSEVLRDALRLWEQREELRRLELARLKREYAEGIASGPGRELSADALLEEFKTKARQRGQS